MLELLVSTEERKRPDKRCCPGVCHLIRRIPWVLQFNDGPGTFIVDRQLDLVRYKYIIPNLHASDNPLIRKGTPCKSDMRMIPNPPLPDPLPSTIAHADVRGRYIRCSDIYKPKIVISDAAFNEALPDTVRSCSAERKEEVIWASNDAGKG